jgi:adenine-specific DNA-methyltransferase
MTFRYIGSKARVVEQIGEHLGYTTGDFFVDAFCGTGAVAEMAAELGWKVRLNDHLSSATKIAHARLFARVDVPFKPFGGYERAVEALNECRPIQGFVWREYSPASKSSTGIERRYFTTANAARIDGVRSQIRSWRDAGRITKKEETLLIADLLSAINRVANIAGTYGCFLSSWTRQADEQLALRPRELKSHSVVVEVSNVDATHVAAAVNDVVYLDPPYTKRQYASYYHILETVALGDAPIVEGVAGLRPWKNLASDYCYKVRALRTLVSLVARLKTRRILLSYSNEGHVPLPALEAGLIQHGTVALYELGTIGRYRPNVQASAKRASVKEYLISIEKALTPRASRERAVA